MMHRRARLIAHSQILDNNAHAATAQKYTPHTTNSTAAAMARRCDKLASSKEKGDFINTLSGCLRKRAILYNKQGECVKKCERAGVLVMHSFRQPETFAKL